MHESRFSIFTGIIVAGACILGAQLVHLQIINQDEFSRVSRGNALRTMRVLPARGAIYDRNGVLLVHNEPMYTVTLTPRYFDTARTPLLAEILDVPDSVITARYQEALKWNRYRPSPAFYDVGFARYSRIKENAFRLPGVEEETNQKRRYLGKSKAAHALGYLREIDDSELDAQRLSGNEARYQLGDLTGKTGVEREYEGFLRGIPGSALKVINIYGLVVHSYMEGREDLAPQSGLDIHLALDDGVQALAESLFVEKRGAAVALDVNTGGIIAMVSQPDFLPATFSRPLEDSTWRYLTSSSDKPLYNRATMNLMPPGSTWKPFMSLMALSEGLIEPEGPNSTIFCPGYHPVGGGRIFRCLEAHGEQTLVQALQNSCNTFFFELGKRMDLSAFHRLANSFGFGVAAPTDLREQTSGLIPDSAYFNARDPAWGIGTVMNLGIGQGNMGVTPLQLARYTAAIASGGTLPAPHLVEYLERPDTGERIVPEVAGHSEEIPVAAEYFELVRHGMRMVMEQGSGRASQIPGIPTGGKTGTAQAPQEMEDHSVFVMFAPYDDPQIAIAVQCENTGQGAWCAAPIASLLAERYLTGEMPSFPNVRWQRALAAASQDTAE